MLTRSEGLRLAITIGLMGVMFVLSVTPGRTHGERPLLVRLVAATPGQLQKFMHVALYAGMAFLWVWTLKAIVSTSVAILVALVVAVAFGALLEGLQARIPGRFGTVQDIFRNAAGAAIGLFTAVFLL